MEKEIRAAGPAQASLLEMDENTITISAGDIGGYTGDTVVLDLSEISLGPAMAELASPWDFSASGISITLNDPASNFDGFSTYFEERDIIEQHREAESIRGRHPGVQAAWEQYQIMLNLARDDEQDDESLDNL